MPADFRVKVDARRVLSKLGDRGIVARPMASMLREVGRQGQEVARQGAPDVVSRGIGYEASPSEATVFAVHPGVRAIEGGRRAGSPMPPQSAISAWASARGLGHLEFVIARAIARRGIRGRFFMRAATEHIRRGMGAYLRAMGRDVEREWRS